MKNALITGITGQDGSYLAELLCEKGYNVYGTVRRKATADYGNAAPLADKVQFIYADMTDSGSLDNALKISKPDEIYNLAAQSFVQISWLQPVFTSEVNGIGTLKLLEGMREICPGARFYQASTSEMFGLVQAIPQNEETPFYPRSPYGVSKLYAHWMMKNYRESYNMFCCGGILFNHESERRGPEFVTRKIADGAARIAGGDRNFCLELGNLDAKRDWGYAGDYVKAMWLMLGRDSPEDYVIASGEAHTVREFAEKAFACAGITLEWSGVGEKETAVDAASGAVVIRVNPKFFRPAEVMFLQGDSTKAEKELGWRREVSFEQLIEKMVEAAMQKRG